MTRDIPPLPWSDLNRLWFAASVMCAALAASAIYGAVNALTRSWPEPFTTDQAGEKPA